MKDSRGVEVSTENGKSLEIYEAALRALNTYRGDPVAIIDEALQEDPDFAMGHILRAEVHTTLWEKSVLPEVEASLTRLADLDNRMNDRERQHANAIRLWAAGDWNTSRGTFDRLLTDYPRDLLALQVGHLFDFYHGDRENLRGRIMRAAPAWTAEDPGYGFVHGMQAFGFEECGSYTQAEEAGRQALTLEPDDCWAHHAVAHVMEMQARQAEGIAFMETRRDHWSQDDNAFKFHNWWHTALYHLDQGNADEPLKIYDQEVRKEPEAIQLMMVDAVALLWRLHLQGIDVGNRWDELADLYEQDDEAGFYVFNDMHALMALMATGRTSAAAARLKTAEEAVAQTGTNGMMSKMVGLPLARAIEAFGRERYSEAVDLIMPVRYRAYIFGGSHAQRDIIHRTLFEAAIRSGQVSLAKALANERVSLKPHCPFSWRLVKRAAKDC